MAMGTSTSLLLIGGELVYIQLEKNINAWRTNSFSKLTINLTHTHTHTNACKHPRTHVRTHARTHTHTHTQHRREKLFFFKLTKIKITTSQN